jgi:hypothetical protein
MIHGLDMTFRIPSSRRSYAVLLVALLNLTLMPCTMALEVVEEAHDCCPPELKAELPQCCDVDDINVGKRGGPVELWDSPDADDVAGGPPGDQVARVSVREYSASDPPDPPSPVEARHKLLCIYLI